MGIQDFNFVNYFSIVHFHCTFIQGELRVLLKPRFVLKTLLIKGSMSEKVVYDFNENLFNTSLDSMLWWYVILLMAEWSVTNAESEPVINEGIGLALTKMGWIGIKQEEIYTSLFIKLESPLLGVDVCNTPCGVKKEALRRLTRRQECLNDKKIGNGLELRRPKV